MEEKEHSVIEVQEKMVNGEQDAIFLSDMEFDERLNALYQAYLQTHQPNDTIRSECHELLLHTKELMDLKSYIHLMYIQGKLYEHDENRNGARYCAMRMLWMKECQEKPKKRRPTYLYFEGYEFHEDELAFIHEYTDFIQDVYKDINRKLFILTAILFVIVCLFLTFILQVTFYIAALEAFILGLLNFWLQKRRMPDIFQKNQTDTSAKHIHEDLFEFERKFMIS